MPHTETSFLNANYGQNVTVECEPGYSFEAAEPTRRRMFPTCLANGNFTNETALKHGCQGTVIPLNTSAVCTCSSLLGFSSTILSFDHIKVVLAPSMIG